MREARRALITVRACRSCQREHPMRHLETQCPECRVRAQGANLRRMWAGLTKEERSALQRDRAFRKHTMQRNPE